MKTLFREGKPARNYYTQADVAKLLGMHPATFWRKVYKDGLYEKPGIRIGGNRRLYYGTAVVESIMAQHRAEQEAASLTEPN